MCDSNLKLPLPFQQILQLHLTRIQIFNGPASTVFSIRDEYRVDRHKVLEFDSSFEMSSLIIQGDQKTSQLIILEGKLTKTCI